MPIEAGDFKTGLTILLDGEIYQVLDFLHVKPGKGAAFLRTKLKNLRTGGIMEQSFNTTTRFDQAIIEKRDLQYSYNADGFYFFMDMESFEMYQLSDEQVGFSKNFIVDGQIVSAKFFEEEILSLDLPERMALTIVDTTDPVSGASSNDTKEAWTETGLMVIVPMFIKNGEKILVYTSDGKYWGRA